MEQEINFYSLLEKKSRWSSWLQLDRLLIVFGIYFTVLMLVSFGSIFSLHRQSNKLSILAAEQIRAQKKLDGFLVRTSADDAQDALLKLGVTGGKNDLLQTAGEYFPDILQALSIAVPKGLWLVSFQVSSSEKTINLSGATLDPRLMQSFLAMLGRQPIFKDFSFQLDSLKNTESNDKKQIATMTFQIMGTGVKGA